MSLLQWLPSKILLLIWLLLRQNIYSMNEKSQRWIHGSITTLLLVLAGILLYWRLQVNQTRFLDVDEFTHLNWAASIARGEKPYIDFFTIFSPVFHTIYSILFFIFSTPEVFLAGRFLSFITFVGVALALVVLFSFIRGFRYALVPLIIFLWLPMPYDKLIEIRPDTLALLCAIWAMTLHVGLLTGKLTSRRWWWGIVGALYTSSVAVLVKFIPFALVGGLAFLLDTEGIRQIYTFPSTLDWKQFRLMKSMSFIVGIAVVTIVFVLWLVSYGNFSLVWYSLTTLAVESNVAEIYVMEPHLFFFPNSSFYGAGGVTMSYVANALIWMLGTVFAAYRLLSARSSSGYSYRRMLAELMVGFICLFSLILYISYYPRKHAQYLGPISVFVAFYAGDALASALDRLVRLKRIQWLALGVLIICGGFILQSNYQVNGIKLSWSNVQQIQETTKLLSYIPTDAEVFDLEGRTVFWKPAYYICCLPFGSYIHALSRKPEPLLDVLERKKTQYIFQGLTNRISVLSWEEQAYIKNNYDPVAGWGDQFWERRRDTL